MEGIKNMTVSELIEKLQKLDIQDAQIVLKDSSGENLDIGEIESVLGFYYVIHPVSTREPRRKVGFLLCFYVGEKSTIMLTFYYV